jgi:glycosyltransferase involved in cell wall biosynthesis
MKENYSLAIVQPILTSYRLPLFTNMSESFKEVNVYAQLPSSEFGICGYQYDGFKFHPIKWKGKCLRFINISQVYNIYKFNEKIIHVADFKYMSLWFLILLCFFSRKKIWLHGQGGYKREGILQYLVYFISIFLSNGYICYSDFSSQELKKMMPDFLHKKISVVNNSLYLNPVSELMLDECFYKKNDVIYIGRIRDGCGLDLLLSACHEAGLVCHVIGECRGRFAISLIEKYPTAIFHGAVYDNVKIEEYAKICFAGVYGGDAGLSVVHYMALGLVPIVHNNVKKHMGPEPSYIKHMFNGMLFERGSMKSLVEQLFILRSDSSLRKKLMISALESYNKLSKPSMDEKFYNIIGGKM